MSRNQGFKQEQKPYKTHQQSRGSKLAHTIASSRLLEMDLLSFRDLVETSEEPMDEDEGTTDLLEEADADTDNDGAEIIDEADQLSAHDNDHSFDDVGQEDEQPQLQIDAYWILQVIEINGKVHCHFYQPEWMRNCKKEYQSVIRDRINRLNSIALWLEKNAGDFLLNPIRESWYEDMADILAPGKMNQKGLVEAINNSAADNSTKNKVMREDYFSRIVDKLLIVWPGKTAVKIKDLIESMKDDGIKKPISDGFSVSIPKQLNDNFNGLTEEPVISSMLNTTLKSTKKKNFENAINELKTKHDQETWNNLRLKNFIARNLVNDGRKHDKILKEYVEKLSDSDGDLSPVELFIKIAINYAIKASELEQLHEYLVQSIK